MATQAQITANRRNAEKSTGPKTTQGKAAVSQNAIKHGLTSQQTIIPGESTADYTMYHYEMLEELNPITPTETMLAERIVDLSWRLKRTVRIQNETIEVLCTPKPPSPMDKITKRLLGSDSAQSNPEQDERTALGTIAVKDFSNARVLDRLMMYERRIENSLYKTINELQKLRLMRKIDPPTVSPSIHSMGCLSPETHRADSRSHSQAQHNEPDNPKSPNNHYTPVTSSQAERPITQTADNVGLNQPPADHHPLTPAVKMQNKPNLPSDRINLTSYKYRNYKNNPPLDTTQKQTQPKIGISQSLSRRAGNLSPTSQGTNPGSKTVLSPESITGSKDLTIAVH